MTNDEINQLVTELKEEGYTWKEIHRFVKQSTLNPPNLKTLQIWYHEGTPNPYQTVKAFPISLEHREEVEAAFVSQLTIMGFTKSEIMKELKNILP